MQIQFYVVLYSAKNIKAAIVHYIEMSKECTFNLSSLLISSYTGFLTVIFLIFYYINIV